MSSPRFQLFAQRFRDEVAPGILAAYGPCDAPAFAQAWNDWTDALCKEGEIPDTEYSNWEHPSRYFNA